ncbi:MAG: methyltransferase domain-containing protein [Bryobacteraceae bacterium]
MNEVKNLSAPPDVRVDVVNRIMDRVGVSTRPEEFVCEVAWSFQLAHGPAQSEGTVESRLRRCTSYPVFVEALEHARPANSVLLYCCGEGLVGLGESYIRSEWRKVWPQVERVETLAISPRLLWDESRWPREQFDAVVSLSQLHFIYNLDQFFEMTGRCLKRGGVYVMAKEVNARYFQQPALQAELAELRAENRKRKRWEAYSPQRYWGFIKRKLGMQKPTERSAFEKANDRIREKLGSRAPLTPVEISRIVEIHRPAETLDGPQIGMNGLDVDHLAKNYLRGYELEWKKTSNHMGFTHTDLLAPKWRKREQELGAQFPDDGAYLSCAWRKQ